MFHGKLFVSFYYKPEHKFNGNVTLVTAKENFVSLEPDYGLKPVSDTYFKSSYFDCLFIGFYNNTLFFIFTAMQGFFKYPFCIR